MLPLLRVLGTAGKELHQKEYSALTADALGLSEEQREERLPSGLQTYVFNRAGWAGWYMQQAGLVEKPKRGHLRITEEGRKLLATNPAVIDNKVLSAYPSFVEKMTKAPSGGTAPGPEIVPPGTQTPTEQIEQAELKLRAQLASDLLDLMSRMDPYRFEQIVVDLLFAMGYGGSRAEAAQVTQVTQKSNDGGIDGIISEDRLGWMSSTCRPSAGRARWGGSRSRVSWARWRGSTPPRASSSPPATSTKTRSITPGASRTRSSSSTASGSPSS